MYSFNDEERAAFLATEDPDTLLAEKYRVTYFV